MTTPQSVHLRKMTLSNMGCIEYLRSKKPINKPLFLCEVFFAFGKIERAIAGTYRVRGAGVAKTWNGAVFKSNETYIPVAVYNAISRSPFYTPYKIYAVPHDSPIGYIYVAEKSDGDIEW